MTTTWILILTVPACLVQYDSYLCWQLDWIINSPVSHISSCVCGEVFPKMTRWEAWTGDQLKEESHYAPVCPCSASSVTKDSDILSQWWENELICTHGSWLLRNCRCLSLPWWLGRHVGLPHGLLVQNKQHFNRISGWFIYTKPEENYSKKSNCPNSCSRVVVLWKIEISSWKWKSMVQNISWFKEENISLSYSINYCFNIQICFYFII